MCAEVFEVFKVFESFTRDFIYAEGDIRVVNYIVQLDGAGGVVLTACSLCRLV